MDRRELFGLKAVVGQENGGADPDEVLPLWPGVPPGGEGVHLELMVEEFSKTPDDHHERLLRHVPAPQLTVFRPQKPDGSALLVISGGGYTVIVIDAEGMATARRMSSAGVTCFVLRYRLPAEGWANRADVPLQDVQRAIRLIRANAAHFGIDPARVGVVGFSAGGHMAASLATRFAEVVYTPVDAADRFTARPDFAGLVYPVITLGEGTHVDSRDQLLGPHADQARIEAYSCERRVTSQTPPVFLTVAQDDTLVPPGANTMQMYLAMARAGRPVELHIFPTGGHGFATSQAHREDFAQLFLRWGGRGGWFKSV